MKSEKEIIKLFKTRRKELRNDAKDKKLKEILKGIPTGHDKWKEFILIGDHRISELEYIVAEILEKKVR